MASRKFMFLFGQNKSGTSLRSVATAELEAIAEICQVKVKETIKCTFIDDLPSDASAYAIMSVDNESIVKTLMERSILSKVALEIWGGGKTYELLNKSLEQNIDVEKRKFLKENVTFCIRVKGIGKKIKTCHQRDKIESIDEKILEFEGRCNLAAPDEEYYIVEDYASAFDEEPTFVYFARVICEGQRNLLNRFSLQNRKFIGNTSMDPEMSFLMSNLAGVRSGSLVFDPFVGSGSLLVSAAHYGGHVMGADINYNIVHSSGKSSRHNVHYRCKDETILNNLRQYDLSHRFIDVMLSDAAQHPWNLRPMFDAIITDPPYGIREGSRKIGAKKPDSVITIPLDGAHYPERKEYELDQVFKDLLHFASATLVPQGRLVYFLPVNRAEYTPRMVPSHPSLTLIGNHEQVLNTHSSRRLIVMRKTSKHDPCAHAHITSDFYSGSNSFRKKYFKGN